MQHSERHTNSLSSFSDIFAFFTNFGGLPEVLLRSSVLLSSFINFDMYSICNFEKTFYKNVYSFCCTRSLLLIIRTILTSGSDQWCFELGSPGARFLSLPISSSSSWAAERAIIGTEYLQWPKTVSSLFSSQNRREFSKEHASDIQLVLALSTQRDKFSAATHNTVFPPTVL